MRMLSTLVRNSNAPLSLFLGILQEIGLKSRWTETTSAHNNTILASSSSSSPSTLHNVIADMTLSTVTKETSNREKEMASYLNTWMRIQTILSHLSIVVQVVSNKINKQYPLYALSKQQIVIGPIWTPNTQSLIIIPITTINTTNMRQWIKWASLVQLFRTVASSWQQTIVIVVLLRSR